MLVCRRRWLVACSACQALFRIWLQEGEDPALAKPVIENLNAVLQLLEYQAVRGACRGRRRTWGQLVAQT